MYFINIRGRRGFKETENDLKRLKKGFDIVDIEKMKTLMQGRERASERED